MVKVLVMGSYSILIFTQFYLSGGMTLFECAVLQLLFMIFVEVSWRNKNG